MAALGAVVMGKVLGKTEAEEAFRPWWDNLSDYLLYGLAMISVVLLPTAMFTASPLWCNPCLEKDLCGGHEIGNQSINSNAWWVNKYCLMNQVDGVVLHLPYFLITATMLLFGIEKVFLTLRKGNVTQNKFFALLVDYEILRSSEGKAGSEVLVSGDELEQSRDLLDLKERLEKSGSFYRSYLAIQIVETLYSFGCFGFILWEIVGDTNGIGLSEPNMYCNVHGRMWECTGHPSAFYTVVMFVTCGMFFLYGLISLYSVLWSMCSCMQTLQQVVGDKDEDEIELSPDFKFLLNLLVLGSGIAPAITAMTVLEPKVLKAVEPKETKIGQTKIDNQLVADASLALDNENQMHLTVEIKEPDHGMHAKLKEMAKVSYRAELKPKAETAVELLHHSKDKTCRQATFLRLTKGEEYTLTIKTLVNGFPVGQVVKTFNTNSLGKLERVETIDIDGILDEEETPAAQQEEEEILKEDEDSQPLNEEGIVLVPQVGEDKEEKQEDNSHENEEETKKAVKKDHRPPIDIFEVQKLSRKMRGNKKLDTVEVVDEKAKASGETNEEQLAENAKDKIVLNLGDLPKTESLPRLASGKPRRKKTQKTAQNVVKTDNPEYAEELKEFEAFFPKSKDSAVTIIKEEVV